MADIQDKGITINENGVHVDISSADTDGGRVDVHVTITPSFIASIFNGIAAIINRRKAPEPPPPLLKE
jgi:hypothetical protein